MVPAVLANIESSKDDSGLIKEHRRRDDSRPGSWSCQLLPCVCVCVCVDVCWRCTHTLVAGLLDTIGE